MYWVGSVRPVGEPVAAVARAHDVGRPYDEVAVREDVARHLLRECLERTVGFVIDPFGRRVVNRTDRPVLGDGVGRVRVEHTGRRHEHVLPHRSPEQLGALPHPTREDRRVVDYRVPLAPLEGGEVVVAVADQGLDVGKEMRCGPTAVEQRHRMAAGQRVPHLVRSDEAGAAEDQYAQPAGWGLGAQGACLAGGWRERGGRRCRGADERATGHGHGTDSPSHMSHRCTSSMTGGKHRMFRQ
jgi:hypothetical protein